jgi:hypothetical protein
MTSVWHELNRRLLGAASPANSRGLDTSIQANWDVPASLLWIVLLAGAALVVWLYWHENPATSRRWKVALAGIRSTLVGLVLLMLYGWTVQLHRTDVPDVVVIVDDSASMGLVDRHDVASLPADIKQRLNAVKLDQPTRVNLAKTLLLENNADWLAGLSRRYHVRYYLAGQQARSFGSSHLEAVAAIRNVAAAQPASRLGDCLDEVLEAQRGRATAAIILLTDGITTDGKSLRDAAQHARRRIIPLFIVGLGSERPPQDLRLADLLAEDRAFVGDLLHFDARISSEGYAGAATMRLLLANSDREDRAEPIVLDTKEVQLDQAGTSQLVRLSHRAAEPGEFEYRVEIVPRQGELNTDNNRMSRKVVVREETIRVLLVQSYPSYEFRFLKQMLARELNVHEPAEGKSLAVRTVLQEADVEYSETDRTAQRIFPVSREELFQYDVLIFGDVNPALLSPSIMNNIYAFVVERGGGVIFISGPRYTPLALDGTPLEALVPCHLDTASLPDSAASIIESFRPRLSPLGNSFAVMQLADAAAVNERLWREELTPIHWFASLPDLRAGVRVLAEHPTARNSAGQPLPIITLQFIGAGKVVFHATDETHRWRFRVGDVYFARYWVQMIRYLCRSKLLAGSRLAELTTDRDQYKSGDEVLLRVRFLDDRQAPAQDDSVKVIIEHNAGQRRTIELRRIATDRGVFEGSAGPLPAGHYRIWLASPTLPGQPPSREFSVVAMPGELARTQMNTAELREAANASLGKFYTFATAGSLLADLPRGRHVRVESLPPKPIWNSPLVAAVFVVLLTAEWLLRKRLGML